MGIRYFEHRRLFQCVDFQTVLVTRRERVSDNFVVQRRRGTGNREQLCIPLRKLRQGRKQCPGVRMARVVEQLFYIRKLDDLSCVQNGNTVSDIRYDTKVVGNKHDSVVVLFLKILDQLQDLCLNRNVQRSCRLIADEDLRTAGKCNRDNDTLSHTAGILERIIIETLLCVRNTNLFHQLKRLCSRFHLADILMFHNNRSDLFSDRDDRVQGSHRVLEYGCNFLTTDLAPVIRVLDFCQVDDAGSVELLRCLIQIAYAEGSLVKNAVSLLLIVQIHTALHCSFECLVQLFDHADFFAQFVTSNGKIDLFGKNLISLSCLVRNFFCCQAGILFFVLCHLCIIRLIVGRIVHGSLFVCLDFFLFCFLQSLDLSIQSGNLGRCLFDFRFFFGSIECLLIVEKFGSLYYKFLDFSICFLTLFLAQRHFFFFFLLQRLHFQEYF